MAMLYGDFSLYIREIHRRGTFTTRYVAEVRAGPKPLGHEVTVKFINYGHLPDEFIGMVGDFDGDGNDIRDYGDRVDQHRKEMPFRNPFIKNVI